MVKLDQNFVSCMVKIDFKLADIKLDRNFCIFIFFENVVLNLISCVYLKCFYTYREINNIFSKFHHPLLRVPKIKEIG